MEAEKLSDNKGTSAIIHDVLSSLGLLMLPLVL